ncbi:MAG: cytochrome c biogenesis protein CcsA [Desulfovermiculus sp.]|nr:cytochrome c biogenesis protein CcsA [Desulfovermiculus sp.]
MQVFFPLSVVTWALLIASQGMIWLYAPVESSMGLVQKIFYLHLPLAWWAFVAFFIVFMASAAFLWKKRPESDLLAAAAAEVGVLFSVLVLVTGSIWGRVSWNTWWTWDPRLTTALVMCFAYCAYLILRQARIPSPRREVMCAVLGILAFADVPLVFVSARLWRSIHPTVFASQGGGMPGEMLLTLGGCLVAWGGLLALLIISRYRQLRIQARLNSLVAGKYW